MTPSYSSKVTVPFFWQSVIPFEMSAATSAHDTATVVVELSGNTYTSAFPDAAVA